MAYEKAAEKDLNADRVNTGATKRAEEIADFNRKAEEGVNVALRGDETAGNKSLKALTGDERFDDNPVVEDDSDDK